MKFLNKEIEDFRQIDQQSQQLTSSAQTPVRFKSLRNLFANSGAQVSQSPSPPVREKHLSPETVYKQSYVPSDQNRSIEEPSISYLQRKRNLGDQLTQEEEDILRRY